MVRGGLLTRSGARTLRSGGMIRIAAASGATLIKAATVQLPTDSVIGTMQVYRGVEEEGGVDWVDPVPLGPSPGAVRGEALFNLYCASCHGLDKELTGPALRGFNRAEEKPWHDQAEVYKFVNNPALYSSCHPHVRSLVDQYSAIMQAFPQLTANQIDDITEYVDPTFSRTRNSEQVVKARECWDKCVAYREAEQVLEEMKFRRQELVAQNGKRVVYQRLQAPPTADTMNGTIPKVSPEEFSSAYYRFEIKSFGWYNVDELLNVPDAVETDFIVHIDQRVSSENNVFLAVPRYKVFQEGGRLDGGTDTYGFLGVDGKLPLPPGTEVVVFVISEKSGQILFGSKRIRSTAHNEFDLPMTAMDKKGFDAAFATLGLDKVTADIADSKNAAGIRSLDDSMQLMRAKMKSLQPDGCNCSICPVADSTNPVAER